MGKRISIKNNTFIKFPFNLDNTKCGNILLCGNLFGLFGRIIEDDETKKCNFSFDDFSTEYFKDNQIANILTIKKVLESNGNIHIVCPKEDEQYFANFIRALIDNDYLCKFGEKISIKQIRNIYKQIRMFPMNEDRVEKEDNKYRDNVDEIIKMIGRREKNKYDVVVLNPPYDGSYHLKILNVALDRLSDNGKLVVVEPATWLINVRKKGKVKVYDEIKRKIEGHVESVVIENLNKEFGTGLYVPFSVTTIDMSKNFETIDFVCCGEHKIVKSIYDCNLIGDYRIVCSIIDKVSKFGDFMKNHITKKKMNGKFCYTKYGELTPVCGCSYVARTDKGVKYDSDSMWLNISNGSFTYGYITTAYHSYNNKISETPLCGYDCGKNLTDKITDNVYGTREELENWKHFIFNNKLPLFINIVLTIDQNNNSKEYLPWLVDNRYTDDEINEMFGFTEEEIKLIEITIKKYERNSPWFKRYMCGKDSVSDEIVQEYIEKISK